MSTTSVQANDPWQLWRNLRWSGLQQFTKENYEAARMSFERARIEARRNKPGCKNEVISICDLAQVFDAEGKNQKSEDYCRQALKLTSDSALITVALETLIALKREEGNYVEVASLLAEADKMADASPDARTIGAASMEKDGAIRLNFRLEHAGMIGEGIAVYLPNDPKYREILMHLGPLKPGDSKFVAPWSHN